MLRTRPTLSMPDTGEHFEFQTSARTGDGVFRFRWTLAPGRKGPPPHRHRHETETFAIVSGRMTLWVGGEKREVGPGDVVAVPPGTTHRFLNHGSEPVVVDVSLDGTRQEDVLLSAVRLLDGREQLPGGEGFRHFLHALRMEGISTPVPAIDVLLRGLARLLRVPEYPPLEGWDEEPAPERVST